MDNSLPQTSVWTSLEKIAFRFSFILIISFIIIMNNGAFNFMTVIIKPFTELMRIITPWFAEHVLHYWYDYSIFTNGSGDTSYDWISILLLLIFALFGSVLWTVLDRKRNSYNACYYWLTVVIRYYIAFILINYGIIKLYHAQMPPPTLNRLMQPLGEFSPMGLAWTYLGYSKSYNIFMGLVEIGSALLLFRRTMVLGALLTVATSVNIMTVNYFYDVPVKIVSTALFLLSLYLLIPHFKSFYRLFIVGEADQIRIQKRPHFSKRWKSIVLNITKIILIGQFVLLGIYLSSKRQDMMAKYYKKTPLMGIYHIIQDADQSAAIPMNWSIITFEYEGRASVRDKYYQNTYMDFTLDTLKKEISINNYTFDYEKQNNGDVMLKRLVDSISEEIHLKKVDHENFELIKRNFNWIQEHPYNR